MFNSTSIEDQAFYLSRMIYRDTKIERYHTDGVVLGMEVYEDMLEVVDQNVKMVQRYHLKMLSIQTEKDADAQLSSMSSFERDEFKRYISVFSFLSKSACNWDPPQIIELPILPEDLSQFILSGHFIECCREHRVLTDPTMRYINKDIYNRVYTLMCKNVLP